MAGKEFPGLFGPILPHNLILTLLCEHNHQARCYSVRSNFSANISSLAFATSLFANIRVFRLEINFRCEAHKILGCADERIYEPLVELLWKLSPSISPLIHHELTLLVSFEFLHT
jgi:hypothetical protein